MCACSFLAFYLGFLCCFSHLCISLDRLLATHYVYFLFLLFYSYFMANKYDDDDDVCALVRTLMRTRWVGLVMLRMSNGISTATCTDTLPPSPTLTVSTVACVSKSNADFCVHGATEPGTRKRMWSPSTTSSATYVILMTAVQCGGRLPTLTVNTSCRHTVR